jgi:succinate dehydrogenase / fumarate reductase flavoprotein subunit
MDAAACIGCGACVAACPNGAGQLFTAAKLAHLNLLPQGQPERGKRSADSFHRELGHIMWEDCGMARSRQGLEHALSRIPELRHEFHRNLFIPGTGEELNQSLEKAGRVADFMELAELMCMDALQREESCGGHFRVEHQTPDGEALRDDDRFAYVAAWEYTGGEPILHKENLTFQHVRPTQRSYA